MRPAEGRNDSTEAALRTGEPDRAALDHLFSVTYEELRRLAASVRGSASPTLNPTALVNEAWLKLHDSPDAPKTSPLHFKRIAARAMRQVLVDATRRRLAGKRGGGARSLEFDETVDGVSRDDRELLALDAALDDLAHLSPRQSQLVECRFFAGMSTGEAAEILGISEATALRDWRAARAWLAREIRQDLAP